ncbi:hypothetical protein [Arthrobacter sp. ES1]|uniref:hypothetical protein n=1 Tax=Arthrobacter sp. ES1 TaxID=1897056 RepID=UPI001CFFE3A7|nr:hypothetical protein [Arthrobacter sp. ES1]MCB5280346.1 hypothetical protein [Arthrobacter sp. ES1]
MPKNQPAPITTEQAIARARYMLAAGQRLTNAADKVSETRNAPAAVNAAAEGVREHELLNYRVATIPGALEPVLEALILAVSTGAADPKELQHAAR